MPITRVIVPAYAVIPRGYGVAYRLHNQDASVCYPMPLNWIVGWWYHAFVRIQHGPA